MSSGRPPAGAGMPAGPVHRCVCAARIAPPHAASFCRPRRPTLPQLSAAHPGARPLPSQWCGSTRLAGCGAVRRLSGRPGAPTVRVTPVRSIRCATCHNLGLSGRWGVSSSSRTIPGSNEHQVFQQSKKARKSESFLESKLSYRSPSSSHCTQHARTDSNRYAAHHLACCQRRPATLAPHARSRRHTQLRLCAVGAAGAQAGTAAPCSLMPHMFRRGLASPTTLHIPPRRMPLTWWLTR